MGLCVTCAVSIKRGQNDSITCSSCSKLYHLSCASLKQDDIDYLNSLNKSWSCVTCAKKSKNTISVAGNSIQPLTSLSTTEPDLKLIISHLDNLRAEQTKLIDLVNAQNEKLNSFDNKFHDIFSQLASIRNENSVLRNDLAAIKNRVDLLESAAPKSNDNRDMFAEFIDRQNRSKNIIVFNVHEQSSHNNTTDTDSITHIFNKLGTDIKPIKISRLGKPNNKSRPLKIELQAASEVFKILGLSCNLKSDQNFKDIRLTSDKSPYQREFLRDLRNQLNVQISKGNLVYNNSLDNNMVPNRNKSLRVNQNVNKTKNYEETYRRSLEDPEGFWAEVGAVVDWYKPWDKVLDNSAQPLTDWFVGGEINACYNAVDRHIKAGKGKKVALIHDSPVTESVTKITYDDLHERVSLLAGALVNLGVVKGDRILIYMPLIPEAIISMLAVVRIGAVHSVVFGGFAARELCARINHATPKVIIAANCGIEPNKIVRYKDILNTALDRVTEKPKHCIIYQRPDMEPSPLTPGIDILWSDALSTAKHHPCVPVEANHPLYILYTSGTTDKPKGIVRPTGGHIATLCWTMSCIYGMTEDDVWWTASDMGWVVGHSYICYGPLCAGITSVMYEGKPDRTPDPGQYFRVIQDHKVNGLFTAPTALRVIRREDPVLEFGSKYNTKSLRTLFVAGEHCDHETLTWAGKVLNVPVLNHWWQTETGHSITATCLGFGHNLKPPMFSAGMPFPGYDVRILKEDGSPCQLLELGRIVVKLPLPPGVMSCLYKAPERFLNTYFNNFIGYYDTMDAGYTDENGYIYVTARDDDVINVAGHRLSTSALEDVILSHPDVGDAAVFGVPETTKGEIPLCLYIKNKNCSKKEEDINDEIVRNVRDLIGPIASFHLCAPVQGLPRTRSGKTARKSLSNLASGKKVTISGTIEDPSVYLNIKQVLQKLGYAKNAPDPEIEK